MIYDWHLNGNALPVSDRMLGKLDGKRREFTCPDARMPKS